MIKKPQNIKDIVKQIISNKTLLQDFINLKKLLIALILAIKSNINI
jgi:hypothetical protein